MIQLEPGDRFDIVYGEKHKLSVVSLDVRTKAKLVKMMNEAKASSEAFAILCDAVELCAPGLTDEQWRTINESHAGEIIGKTLSNAMLSEDERKKFE
jgi:hypothetical protein